MQKTLLFGGIIIIMAGLVLFAISQKNNLNTISDKLKGTDAENAPKVVMLGNSITFGGNWNTLLGRQDVQNHGVNGETTAEMLERLDRIVALRPEICLIMGGINDLSQGIAPETINDNIRKMTNVLSQRGVRPMVQSVLYVAEYYPQAAAYNAKVEETNALLIETCREMSVKYLDVNQMLGNTLFLKPEYSEDGIHLTPLAYAKWAEAIRPVILERLEQP